MVRRPAKLVLATLGGLALAVLATLQAGSSVLIPKDPQLAAQLLPINGLALEQAATRRFMAGVETEEDIVPAAKAVVPMAKRAFAHDPLSPKSLALMAFAEDDPAAKQQLLAGATRLNRRDLLLQGLVLDGQVAAKNYGAALQTLDYILRVHPEQTSSFFPILTEALKDDAAASELGGLLDNTSPWHANFLNFASGKRDALPNLAKLRLARDGVSRDVDQRLVSGLVAGGKIDLAHDVYVKAVGQAGAADTGARLGWGADFPPFDWRLADDAGFRAQPAIGDLTLEIFVRSGKGGVLAERLVKAPAAGSIIKLSHTITPAAQVKDVRLQAGCPGDEEPVLDRPLRIQPMRITLPDLSDRCEFVKLQIYGRSWSGRANIRGDINQLEIVAN